MSGVICRLRGHQWARWVRVEFLNAEGTRPYPEVRYCHRCLRFQANVTAALIWHFGDVLGSPITAHEVKA